MNCSPRDLQRVLVKSPVCRNLPAASSTPIVNQYRAQPKGANTHPVGSVYLQSAKCRGVILRVEDNPSELFRTILSPIPSHQSVAGSAPSLRNLPANYLIWALYATCLTMQTIPRIQNQPFALKLIHFCRTKERTGMTSVISAALLTIALICKGDMRRLIFPMNGARQAHRGQPVDPSIVVSMQSHPSHPFGIRFGL